MLLPSLTKSMNTNSIEIEVSQLTKTMTNITVCPGAPKKKQRKYNHDDDEIIHKLSIPSVCPPAPKKKHRKIFATIQPEVARPLF